MRIGKRSSQSMTGEIQPITFRELESRVNVIRSRAKGPTRYTIDPEAVNRTQQLIPTRTVLPDLETDQFSTNFNPKQPEIAVSRPTSKSIKTKPAVRRSVQFASVEPEKRRPSTSYKRGGRPITANRGVEGGVVEGEVRGEAHALIFKQEMGELQSLYEHLAAILGCVKEGDLGAVEQAIANYVGFMQSKRLSFIDDFIQGRERKLQRVVRQARLHESLSIAYLFLEMAQSRIQNHESYLVNFLGYCLSNVLLTARLYLKKEGRAEFEQGEFQAALKRVQICSFGGLLTNLEDIFLRLQHNNEIITMMHRKLGKFNPKFQTCIQLFFRNAERNRTSCAQCTYYIFEYLAMHIHEAELTGFSSSLQIAPIPYAPPPRKNYTLIIEPLGILVSDGRTRPYLFQFLEWASKFFDILLWTWEMPYEPEVEKIYGKLEEYLCGKLYRYHCIQENQIWVKDLARLGRSIEKVLIVDYDKRIYKRQPKNGIELRWRHSPHSKDKGLLFLCQILQEMVTSESIVEDMTTIYAEELYNIRGY